VPRHCLRLEVNVRLPLLRLPLRARLGRGLPKFSNQGGLSLAAQVGLQRGQRTAVRRRLLGPGRRPPGTIVTSSRMIQVIPFVVSRLIGAVRFFEYAPLLPVLLLLPDLAIWMKATGTMGAASLFPYTEPYLAIERKRSRMLRPLCRLLPLPLPNGFKETALRPGRLPSPSVFPVLAITGPAASSPHRLSSAVRATCVKVMLGAGAEAVGGRCAWLAPKVAAPARTSLARDRRVAATAFVYMIIISRRSLRLSPRPLVCLVVFASSKARATVRLPVSRRCVARALPLRRTAGITMMPMMIMNGNALWTRVVPRAWASAAILAPAPRRIARRSAAGVLPARLTAATTMMMMLIMNVIVFRPSGVPSPCASPNARQALTLVRRAARGA
jgi:hypothetical protein